MNTNDSALKKNPRKIAQIIRYPLLTKISIDKRLKNLSLSLSQRQQKTQLQKEPINTEFKLPSRKKLDNLYKRIKQLNRQNDLIRSREFYQYNQSAISDSSFKTLQSPIKPGFQAQRKMKFNLLQRKYSNKQPDDHDFEINTICEVDLSPHKEEYTLAQAFSKRERYQKINQPLSSDILTQNVKQYLSVQKISIRDIQGSLLSKSKISKRYQLASLLDSLQIEEDKQKLPLIKSINLSPPRPKKNIDEQKQKQKSIFQLKRKIKFRPPFQLYYYRDFIWKVAYSYQNIIQTPDKYEQKIKFYVGKGNNSNLIKGLMRRRSWFQITDRYQQADFIWTQIKISSIYSIQQKQISDKKYSQSELQLINSKKMDNLNQLAIIFNEIQKQKWKTYWNINKQHQNQIKPNFRFRCKKLKLSQNKYNQRNNFKIHNHFCNNFIIGNKKALFKIMSDYYNSLNIDVFQKLPLTFHITLGIQDPQFLKFLQTYYAIAKINKSKAPSIHKRNAWIVKPGQNTNRGTGIIVCLQLSQIKSILKNKQIHSDGTKKTYILQKYIQNPLLYKKRKFDLRHYMMINCNNGIIKGYWYRKGYVRTTSSEFTLKVSGSSVHLTNDAIQKDLPDYGKYQKANKITYQQLDNYVKKHDPNFDFYKLIYPKMKQIATEAVCASALHIDPDRRTNNFQVFGLDFMIDDNYNVLLIQINSNPCLQTNCQVLYNIIPKFIENTLQICLDPLFPPPLDFCPKTDIYHGNLSEQNNYQVIFDERIDKAQKFHSQVLNSPQDEDAQFDDDGQDFNQQS